MPLSDPIDMEAFESAIRSWFSTSIEAEVIWANQSAPRPPYPYGSLKITAGPMKYSQMWERRTDTNLARGNGKEVRFEIGVPCRFEVLCQVFVKRSDSRHPEAHALNLLTRASFRLGLEAVATALNEENISTVSVGSVLNPGELISDAYVSRAAVTVVFGTVLSLEEYTGYIKTVDIESTELGIDQRIGVL